MNPITKQHRLAVARAWEKETQLTPFVQRWVDGGQIERDCFAPTLNTLERLAQLVADAEGAWIPCEERLPSLPGMYLCFHEKHGQDVMFFTGESWGKTSFWDHEDGTHWMPLPKPPEQP